LGYKLKNKNKMTQEMLRMQMLAGIITEGQYKEKMDENISDLEVKWTPEYYEATEKYGDEAYDEKGLADGFQMRDDKKVKEIVGYYVPEGAENENDEEFDIIGYIYSTSGKDIESYSEDELDGAFMNALENSKGLNETKLNEETSDEKIERYEKYSYTLDGENITPDKIAFYDNILKAKIDGKLYNLRIPDENGVVELNPIKGKTGSYT
jgi:hypothetical protein